MSPIGSRSSHASNQTGRAQHDGTLSIEQINRAMRFSKLIGKSDAKLASLFVQARRKGLMSVALAETGTTAEFADLPSGVKASALRGKVMIAGAVIDAAMRAGGKMEPASIEAIREAIRQAALQTIGGDDEEGDAQSGSSARSQWTRGRKKTPAMARY